MTLRVIDPQTGKYPDLAGLAREPWTGRLIRLGGGFALGEEGELYLLDCSGNYALCPEGRFEVEEPPSNAFCAKCGDEVLCPGCPEAKTREQRSAEPKRLSG